MSPNCRVVVLLAVACVGAVVVMRVQAWIDEVMENRRRLQQRIDRWKADVAKLHARKPAAVVWVKPEVMPRRDRVVIDFRRPPQGLHHSGQ